MAGMYRVIDFHIYANFLFKPGYLLRYGKHGLDDCHTCFGRIVYCNIKHISKRYKEGYV